MRRWAIVAGVVIGLGALVCGVPVGIGAALPVKHVAGVEAEIPADVADIYAAITDVDQYPSWRTGVSAVTWRNDGMARDPAHDVWVESSSFGDVPFHRLEAEAPYRVVTEIAADDLGFGGTWTFDLRPTERGTDVRILEQGRVDTPLFRFLTRFVFGYYGSLDQYLVDLGARFGVTLTPTHLVGVGER